MFAPASTSAARSRIRRSSQVIQGSHSAPLRISVSMPLPLPSLTWLGKVAPPRPTMPQSRSQASDASRLAAW